MLGEARDDHDRETVLSTYAWTVALLGSAAAVVLLPFATAIAGDIWASPDSTSMVILAILLVPISALQAALVTTQRLLARPVPFAVLATIDLIAQTSLSVVFVMLGWGALGVVAGLLIGSLIGLAVAIAWTRTIVLTRPMWALGRSMVRRGMPFLPAAVGFVVANYVIRYLLVRAEGPAAVGCSGSQSVSRRDGVGVECVLDGLGTIRFGPAGQ